MTFASTTLWVMPSDPISIPHVAHPGRAVYRSVLSNISALRVGEVDHFALRLFLQGEVLSASRRWINAVALLILINLLAPWIVLLEINSYSQSCR